MLEFLARSLERGLAARDRSDPKRFLDIDYQRFVADPTKAVESIYDYFELELPTEAEAAMRAHVRDNPRGKHGEHDYSLADYGLTPEAVTKRLAFYIDRFL